MRVVTAFAPLACLMLSAPARAEGPDLERVLAESVAGKAARAELENATERYQGVIHCLERRIRTLDERAKTAPDDTTRRTLLERRAGRVTHLRTLFAGMRQALAAAEKGRTDAVAACARRHAEGLPDDGLTTATIERMDRDGCEPERVALAPISTPTDAQRDDLCRDEE